MTRSDVTVCSWKSPTPSAGNTGLYLSRSISAKQSGWPGNQQNLATDVRMCVHRTRHMSATPATRCSASVTQRASISVNVEAVGQCRKRLCTCMREGKRRPLWASAKLKPTLFRANTLHNRLFPEPLTVYRGKRVVSRPFHCSYNHRQ